MDNFQDFKNALSNLENGWTNQWAFLDQREKLLAQKEYALKNKKILQNEGYDVVDIYKQLEEFDQCIERQQPITDDDDEKILLASLEYANENRCIICSKFNQNISMLDSLLKDKSEIERRKHQYKYDVSVTLLAFYISYREKIDMFETVKNFLTYNDYLIKKYPNDKQNFYSTPYIIRYLKHLIKIKEFEKAKFLLDNFIISPIGKMDTDALEKIKEKLVLKISNAKS